MNRIIMLLLALTGSVAVAQTVIPYGTLVLKTDQRIDFVNLKLENGYATLNDVSTNKTVSYPMSSVKAIQGKAADPSQVQQNIASNNTPAGHSKVDKFEVVDPDLTDGKFRPLYPDGIYATREDFINKKPTSTVKIVPKTIDGFEREVLTRIANQCFFYYAGDDSKVKNMFAISYKGHLFFQLEAILKNRNKTDRAQTNSRFNQFVRVLMGGENYFYTEAELANQWEQGFAHGALGGAVGSAVAAGSVHTKGIVWDFENKEFNIFKNCKDFNVFIQDKLPGGNIECKRSQPAITDVRRIIDEIK